MRLLAILVCLGSLAGCWPGRCQGGLRGVGLPAPGEAVAELDRNQPHLTINLDTNLKTGPEILAASNLTTSSVLLEGPAGMVPLAIEASFNASAHSCASSGTLRATSTTPLVPGDYTFIVLMDQVKWPAIHRDDVTTWQGHPAMIRKYRVP